MVDTTTHTVLQTCQELHVQLKVRVASCLGKKTFSLWSRCAGKVHDCRRAEQSVTAWIRTAHLDQRHTPPSFQARKRWPAQAGKGRRALNSLENRQSNEHICFLNIIWLCAVKTPACPVTALNAQAKLILLGTARCWKHLPPPNPSPANDFTGNGKNT